MTLRYFEVIASGHDTADTRFDRDGMYVGYSALIQAHSMEAAEAALRKEKRFRRFMRQSGLDWRTVPVVAEMTTLERGI